MRVRAGVVYVVVMNDSDILVGTNVRPATHGQKTKKEFASIDALSIEALSTIVHISFSLKNVLRCHRIRFGVSMPPESNAERFARPSYAAADVPARFIAGCVVCQNMPLQDSILHASA